MLSHDLENIMSMVTYREKRRIVCDICGHIVPRKAEGRVIKDSVSNFRMDVCSGKCADRYWERYQPPPFLPADIKHCQRCGTILAGTGCLVSGMVLCHPCSNTGVVLHKSEVSQC